jgi:hypothetical protein
MRMRRSPNGKNPLWIGFSDRENGSFLDFIITFVRAMEACPILVKPV